MKTSNPPFTNTRHTLKLLAEPSRKRVRTTTLTLLSLAIASGGLRAGTFSLLAPNFFGPGDEIFYPGPAAVGVGTGGEVDGLSFGHFGVNSLAMIGGVEFSVDAGSMGAAPGLPIGLEVGAFDSASADIYGSPLTGGHIGAWDGNGAGPGPNGLGGSPGLGLMDLPLGDDIDGWDSRIFGPVPPPVYFSLAGASGGASSGDILFAPTVGGYSGVGAAGIYATLGALGLVTEDNVDALVVLDNDGAPGDFTPGVDSILFSLAPGSPTLAAFGLSAADIFVDTGSIGPLGVPAVGGPGTPGFIASAGSMGLAFTDNLNALDIILVPEPGTSGLFAIGLLALVNRRRR